MSYNPYFSACLFSRNSVFSLTTNQPEQYLSYFFSEANRANVIDGALKKIGLRPSHSIVVTCPMWSEILWSRMTKQASGWLWWRDPYNKVQIFWDARFSYAVRQVGLYLNVIRVTYLSRDVVLQNILEETHIYEFDC